MNNMKAILISFVVLFFSNSISAQKIVASISNGAEFWLTKSDKSILLSKQNIPLRFNTIINDHATIEIDDKQTAQTIEGFGFALTGGSAQVISQLNENVKKQLLQELFGTKELGIGVSYLRISIGASDLDSTVFSYDDIPSGETDLSLSKFSLKPDKQWLMPLLKEILVINPKIKIMACPWSPPVWMKNNKSTKGGSLQAKYYNVYANYFVKYIQQMKLEGIPIDAITPQNEPLHPGNNPSLLMLANEQANFIKNDLGPAFQKANLATKIIIYDHNCNKPEYPISILNDAGAKKYIAGSAFHLYEGNIDALTKVHNAHPNKGLYFTEQWTSSEGDFGGDFKWHIKNVVIGSMNNWSKVALEWNLANNAVYGPHTDGGCTQCKGAITINSSSAYSKNVAFYIIAHASKFIPAGSIKIASSVIGNLQNAAFKTPFGKTVLIVENEGNTVEFFNIKSNGKWITTSLDAGSVGTFIW